MSPPRVFSADVVQTPEQVAGLLRDFFAEHPAAAVMEDGKLLFEMGSAQFAVTTEHGRCVLQLWSAERNSVRRVLAAVARGAALRLQTQRPGQTGSKLVELVPDRKMRVKAPREKGRAEFLKLLERILLRRFADWKADGFRAAMDLEKSFGPAYVRGSLVRGQEAWAVIAVGPDESGSTIDGILTLGVLWLHHCRENAGGKRLYRGLRMIVPRGGATLTLARVAWMNTDAAAWEVWELDAEEEELELRDAADQGNLRTRLVHHPDAEGARERFAAAVAAVRALVPEAEQGRVEERLRSTAELAFCLHGMEFARARVSLAPGSFARTIEVSVGAGANEMALTERNAEALRATVAELFARRRADAEGRVTDPLFRAAPERWLESVLRADLAPLTRHLGPAPLHALGGAKQGRGYSDEDQDSFGNRADDVVAAGAVAEASTVIPRLDPVHVYSQVPAIAGASDRGMLDLLGVTADGRLAVIELKAADDLHLALQGLDYWIRVRHHHAQTGDSRGGLGEFQRHGYFRDVVLSPLEPRLYLVAPALHVHPATEVVLRYVSPRVEWHLLAIDERWRTKVRVIWRKQGGVGARGHA